jgi:hypothetical protein
MEVLQSIGEKWADDFLIIMVNNKDDINFGSLKG